MVCFSILYYLVSCQCLFVLFLMFSKVYGNSLYFYAGEDVSFKVIASRMCVCVRVRVHQMTFLFFFFFCITTRPGVLQDEVRVVLRVVQHMFLTR